MPKKKTTKPENKNRHKGKLTLVKAMPETKWVPPWESGVPGPTQETNSSEENFSPQNWDHITPKRKAIRQLFISEYVKDFNGMRAVKRMGWVTTEPGVTASVWLDEPYTLWLLDNFVRETVEENLIVRNTIIAGLVRESNSRGLDCSGASRVAALGKLAKIMGMEITKVVVDPVSTGVMFVPLGGTSAEWEKNAAKQQADLQKQAKTG